MKFGLIVAAVGFFTFVTLAAARLEWFWVIAAIGSVVIGAAVDAGIGSKRGD